MPVPQQNQGGTGILPVAEIMNRQDACSTTKSRWNRDFACCEHKHNIYPDE
ncbi:hypothetical protein [Microcoleus sp.]|uniref:hypothetical protein n=1 Tax=Microcoleus sp. TaxID=44472 RepID=UPI00403EA197